MAIEPTTMQTAIMKMWLDEFNKFTTCKPTKESKAKARIAADQICELMGIKDALRAISLDGELRPPPRWPETDVVPVGGGDGLITCEVRTMHPERGKLTVKIGLKRERKTFDAAQIYEALARGQFELKKMVG